MSEFASLPWDGVTGEIPPVDRLRTALQTRDLYVYCGHGDGGKYLPYKEVQSLRHCSAALLMGCSSGALRSHGQLTPTGMALAYLHARCPALVANLWDVTDGDIDRFSVSLLRHCTREGGSLLVSLAKARGACKLRFLTGSAAICYGVPLQFQPQDGA